MTAFLAKVAWQLTTGLRGGAHVDNLVNVLDGGVAGPGVGGGGSPSDGMLELVVMLFWESVNGSNVVEYGGRINVVECEREL